MESPFKEPVQRPLKAFGETIKPIPIADQSNRTLQVSRKMSVIPWAIGAFFVGAIVSGMIVAFSSSVFRPEPKPAVIAVEGLAADAQLYIDGELIEGKGRVQEIPVLAGKHAVIAMKEGFTHFVEFATVEAGAKKSLKVTLLPNKPAPVVITASPVIHPTVVPIEDEKKALVQIENSEERPVVTVKEVAPPESPTPPVPTLPTIANPNPNAPYRPVIESKIGMKFALIPAGEFMMGSSDADLFGLQNEKPQRLVKIPNAYYVGIYEVSDAFYSKFMGRPLAKEEYGLYAAVRVPFKDAIAFCNMLSEFDGLTPYYRLGNNSSASGSGYRLPREAEWEYACRAGSSTSFSHGNVLMGMNDFTWHMENAGRELQKIGLKRPNKYGLYDMAGGVEEWCYDRIDTPFEKLLADDPKDLNLDGYWVLRGGSIDLEARYCRPAYRRALNYGTPSIGFRIVRNADTDTLQSSEKFKESQPKSSAKAPGTAKPKPAKKR